MAIKANLIIDQGCTYSTQMSINDTNGTPVNLAGFTAAGQIRKHYTSSNSVSFDCTLYPDTGKLVLSLSANSTSTMRPGRYVYDIELADSAGQISRVIEGIVTITPNVTRST